MLLKRASIACALRKAYVFNILLCRVLKRSCFITFAIETQPNYITTEVYNLYYILTIIYNVYIHW